MNDSIKHKIEVLLNVSRRFEKENITWALGASSMLYLRGIVDTFNDIDIMADNEDIEKIKKVMSYIGEEIRIESNEGYKTKNFLEYIVDGVEVDIMVDMVIVCDGIDYDCSLEKEDIDTVVEIENAKIYLHSLEKWKFYYKLMGRSNKLKIIQNGTK